MRQEFGFFLDDAALQWEAETDPPVEFLARLRASKTDIIVHLQGLEAERKAHNEQSSKRDNLDAECRAGGFRIAARDRVHLVRKDRHRR